MRNLVIPVILSMTIIVAGIFAFMPSEKASTVDAEIIAALQGANIVRVEFDIDQVDDGSNITWTQLVTFDRIQGEGAWQIDKLFLCDFTTNQYRVEIGFDIENDVVGSNNVPARPNYVSSGDEDDARSYSIGSSEDYEGDCFDALLTWHDADCADGGACNDMGNNPNTVLRTYLGGDEDNNVVMRFSSSCDDTEDTDGATLIAYIVGLVDAGQMDISSLQSTALTGCDD